MVDFGRLSTGRAALRGVTLLSLAALTLTLTMTSAPAAVSLPPAADAPSVPILGQVALKEGAETGKPSAVGTLHGVRRIPGGTVIYFSVGYPAGTKADLVTTLDSGSPGYSRVKQSNWFGANMLVDQVGRKAYTGLQHTPVDDPRFRGDPLCICSKIPYYPPAGEAIVFYQVVAELPASVAFVDVYFVSQVIGHVKVDSGPMTPEVDTGPMVPVGDFSEPILLGTGWPKIDAAAVASSVEPAKSVVDLNTAVANLEGTVTTRTTPKQVSVALASDVLFATDQATLSPKAKAVLVRAAEDVKAAGGAGTLQVIGYTDNTGTTAHNVDLSRRRAAAVARAIKPLLPAGVQLPTSGKGEADPVTSNETAEGRALNRRVSVVFAPAGGAK